MSAHPAHADPIRYPWFLETFDGYPYPIQRADAIRYFVLHHFGGIYIDLDDVCTTCDLIGA
jgi:mannosyltransferase OCH1-like enzyme